jgi:fatty acid desaturase
MSKQQSHLLPRLESHEIPAFAHGIKNDIKNLMLLKPARFFTALVLDWIIILTTIIGWLYLENPWLLPLAMLIIGTRQHALAILIHDAVHGLVVRDRKWNNRIAKWFIAWPMGADYDSYRYVHLKHHLHTSSDQDPDWLHHKAWQTELPASRFHFLKYFAKMVLGYGFIDAFRTLTYWQKTNPKSRRFGPEKWTVLALLALTVVGLTSGQWKYLAYFVLLWLAPFALVGYPINLLRGMVEHFGIRFRSNDEQNHGLRKTRSTMANAVERFFLVPHHVALHLEHHLYDTIPFYNLPELAKLLRRQPEFLQKALVYDSYLGSKGSVRSLIQDKALTAKEAG